MTPALGRLLEALERLPGIGPRSAARLADHLFRVPEAEALALADAIRDLRARVAPCSLCRTPTETSPCAICADTTRRRDLVLVVETPRDLVALEAAGVYDGLYYVLGGRHSPLEDEALGAEDVERLRARLREGPVTEVCLGMNPDLEGDGTLQFLSEALKPLGIRTTRLGRGLPAGGQIEYQNAAALADAFAERRPLP